MRAVIEIILAIVITISAGSISKKIYFSIKKEAIIKVSTGLSSLEDFTHKLRSKK
jgi:hypothetical protein